MKLKVQFLLYCESPKYIAKLFSPQYSYRVCLQVNNSAEEIDKSIDYPDVRMFFTKLTQSNSQVYDAAIDTPWVRPTKGTNTETKYIYLRTLKTHHSV